MLNKTSHIMEVTILLANTMQFILLLIYIVAPTAVTFNGSTEARVELNSYFAVLCTAADGNPPPTLTWTFPSTSSAKQSPGGGGQLLYFESAKRSDTGNYRCEGTNVVGVASETLDFKTLG